MDDNDKLKETIKQSLAPRVKEVFDLDLNFFCALEPRNAIQVRGNLKSYFAGAGLNTKEIQYFKDRMTIYAALICKEDPYKEIADLVKEAIAEIIEGHLIDIYEKSDSYPLC